MTPGRLRNCSVYTTDSGGASTTNRSSNHSRTSSDGGGPQSDRSYDSLLEVPECVPPFSPLSPVWSPHASTPRSSTIFHGQSAGPTRPAAFGMCIHPTTRRQPAPDGRFFSRVVSTPGAPSCGGVFRTAASCDACVLTGAVRDAIGAVGYGVGVFRAMPSHHVSPCPRALRCRSGRAPSNPSPPPACATCSSATSCLFGCDPLPPLQRSLSPTVPK